MNEQPIKRIPDSIREKLREGFPDKAYSAHPTKTFLTTLKAMFIVERLNDVFGIGRWDLTHEVVERTDNYVLLKGQLAIHDYDCYVPSQYGGHSTTGKNTEIADGYKSAVTDLLSKSASYLEIGIELFKGEIKVPNRDDKKYTGSNQTIENEKKWLNKGDPKWNEAVEYLKKDGNTIGGILKNWKVSKDNQKELMNLAIK